LEEAVSMIQDEYQAFIIIRFMDSQGAE
jgi:hypothetical protein